MNGTLFLCCNNLRAASLLNAEFLQVRPTLQIDLGKKHAHMVHESGPSPWLPPASATNCTTSGGAGATSYAMHLLSLPYVVHVCYLRMRKGQLACAARSCTSACILQKHRELDASPWPPEQQMSQLKLLMPQRRQHRMQHRMPCGQPIQEYPHGADQLS